MPPFSFGIHLDEADVRRLCGDATFVRADLLQRHGHVESPRVKGSTLSATVRGTWRRRYRTEVPASGSRAGLACTCGAGGYCPHVGAILLQRIRQPGTFADSGVRPAHADRSRLAVALASPDETPPFSENPAFSEAPVQELARRLDLRTAADLRDVALARGAAVPRSLGKAAIVARLAETLTLPENVDAALAALSPNERLGLDASYLLGGGRPIDVGRGDRRDGQPETILAAYRALGGGEVSPLPRLIGAGLVLEDGISGYSTQRYGVPESVQARLWPLDETFAPLRPSHGLAGDRPTPPAPDYRFDDLLAVIAKELRSHPVHAHLFDSPDFTIAEGWTVQQPDVRVIANPAARLNLSLLPSHPAVRADDLLALEDRTGLPAEAIEFTLELALALGFLDAVGRLTLREERWRDFLRLAPSVQTEAMVAAWLSQVDWTVLSSVMGPAGEFGLYYRPDYLTSLPILRPEVRALSRLVTRLVRRLRSTTWYRVAGLVEAIRPLTTSPEIGLHITSPATSGSGGPRRWWIAERGQPDAPLDLAAPSDWTRFHGALVEALLSGPLYWLGLVDLTPTTSGTTRFRPLSPVDAGSETVTPAAEQASGIIIDADLTVHVPVGQVDPALAGFLARAAELDGSSPSELRYRITAEGAQAVFDDGVGGPEVIETLASFAPLPEPARATIERWWAGYGSIRLYDELTLIELGDDLLLNELQATTSLSKALIHSFSPRWIAVDPRMAGDLQAELARLGYAPRVVEGS